VLPRLVNDLGVVRILHPGGACSDGWIVGSATVEPIFSALDFRDEHGATARLDGVVSSRDDVFLVEPALVFDGARHVLKVLGLPLLGLLLIKLLNVSLVIPAIFERFR
jgi:hypothetical protein